MIDPKTAIEYAWKGATAICVAIFAKKSGEALSEKNEKKRRSLLLEEERLINNHLRK